MRSPIALVQLASIAQADLTSPQVPAFRGAENTVYAGWRDWTAPIGGGLGHLPDDPATTAGGASIVVQRGPAFVVQNGVACAGAGWGVSVSTGSPTGRVVQEVVVQVAAPGIAGAVCAFGYASPGGDDFVSPYEVLDLAPGERLYRFHLAAIGLDPGALVDVFSGYIRLDLPGGTLCLDEVQLDVRFALDGAFDPGCALSNPNSLGVIAGCDVRGATAASANDCVLTASALPPGAFGYFLASETLQPAACPTGCGNTQGRLCLAGNVARIGPPLQATAGLVIENTLDLTAVPTQPVSAAVAGSTWYFQCWYRDANPQPTSNFTRTAAMAFQ